MKAIPTTYVGTTQALAFLRKHHGMYRVPPGELFAFAENVDQDSEVYVLVCETNRHLEIVNCRSTGHLGLTDRHLDSLTTKARAEAKQCHISPPYSVTFVNRFGAFSYAELSDAKRRVA